MHFWKDKQGNKLTFKEFFHKWKLGIEGITVSQLTSQTLRGMKIILIGLLCGIVVCLFNIRNLWWLLIILIGSLYVNITQYIGTWQKKKALKDIEKQFIDPVDIPEPKAFSDMEKVKLNQRICE